MDPPNYEVAWLFTSGHDWAGANFLIAPIFSLISRCKPIRINYYLLLGED